MGPASLPLWIDDAEWRGFATMDTSRARAAGLVTRPLEETLRDTLAFEEARTVPRAPGSPTTTSGGCRRPCSAGEAAPPAPPLA